IFSPRCSAARRDPAGGGRRRYHGAPRRGRPLRVATRCRCWQSPRPWRRGGAEVLEEALRAAWAVGAGIVAPGAFVVRAAGLGRGALERAALAVAFGYLL